MDATDDDRDRFGAPLRGGRLGFRQMQWAEAAYDDVVVRHLKSADRDDSAAETPTVRGARKNDMPTTFTHTGPGGDKLAIVRYATPDPRRFPGPRPAWVTFHGGGWSAGARPIPCPAKALAERGIVTLRASIA